MTDTEKEEYKSDWEVMTYRTLNRKYKRSKNTLKKIARELGCRLPKPRPDGQISIFRREKDMERYVVDIENNLEHLPVDEATEIKPLVDRFRETLKSDLPKNSRNAILIDLATRISAAYAILSPSLGGLLTGMANYLKTMVYECRTSGEQEHQELDEAQLKNLKKQFIKEALDDIAHELNETQRRLFEHLVQVATDRALECRRLQNEVPQQQLPENNE